MKILLLTIGAITAIAAVEGMFWVLLTAADRQDRKPEAREDYPWDWTKEQEQQVEAAMELICDKCKDKDCLDPDETVEACAMCAIRDALYMLTEGERDGS